VRTYLLNPPFIPHFARDMRWQDTGRGGTLYYPIWLAYATGVMEEQNEVRLVDAPVRGWDTQRTINDIKKFNPGLIIVDTSFPTLTHDISQTEAIKEAHPNASIVIVGPPASQFSDRILGSQGVDFVARWEYDLTLKELAHILDKNEDLKTVKGLSYKSEGRIIHNPDREFTTTQELDKIPFVSKVYQEHLNPDDYFLNYSLHPEVQIFASRGCPFQCTFCAAKNLWKAQGSKVRYKPIEAVIDEIKYLKRNYNIDSFYIADDTFAMSQERAIEFCEQLLRGRRNKNNTR